MIQLKIYSCDFSEPYRYTNSLSKDMNIVIWFIQLFSHQRIECDIVWNLITLNLDCLICHSEEKFQTSLQPVNSQYFCLGFLWNKNLISVKQVIIKFLKVWKILSFWISKYQLKKFIMYYRPHIFKFIPSNQWILVFFSFLGFFLYFIISIVFNYSNKRNEIYFWKYITFSPQFN